MPNNNLRDKSGLMQRQKQSELIPLATWAKICKGRLSESAVQYSK